MSNTFLEQVKQRRSYYAISSEAVIGDDKLEQIIGDAVNYTPSSFNSQSSRVVILLGEHHHKLWNIAKETLRAIVPADSFAATEERLAGFDSGYGTILFFEDQEVINGLQEQFPTYQDNFPIWSNQSGGMLQFVVWTALTAEGYGASLQHYNPLIDEQVKAEWGLPENWKLLAQMPFGKQEAQPGEKEFAPLETRLKVFK
ncbi:nitroreductase family protein [Paenibacillus sp. 1P07SE]|uniref:nitroreductase family protein n=1 Tax=Paenibacillus sp. 1P07SE TaxID=3132209 RepID=UPI0039A772D2